MWLFLTLTKAAWWIACAQRKAPRKGGEWEVKGSTQNPTRDGPIESIEPCQLWGREIRMSQRKSPGQERPAFEECRPRMPTGVKLRRRQRTHKPIFCAEPPGAEPSSAS